MLSAFLARDRVRFAFGILIVLLTAAVYAPVWQFDFILLDDPRYVIENVDVRTGITSENVRWSFTTLLDGNWFPLTWLSLMCDAELYGDWPGGFHITNAALHALNAVLVLALFGSMTGRWARSAAVAALFAIHPLHVESVAWVSERKDVLSTLFGLVALLAYVQYARGNRRTHYLLALAAFVCSLLSKQTLVTLPFVLLLLDAWPLGRWSAPDGEARATSRLILEKVPFFVVSAVFCTVAVVAQSSNHAISSLESISLRARLLNALIVYCEYLRKTVAPLDLAVFYPHPGENVNLAATAMAALFLLAVMALAIVKLRRWPFLFVGWSWYLGTLVPMIGIVQIGSQQMADRYTYFPLIGTFAAAVWLISELAAHARARTYGLPVAAVVSIALLAGMASFQVSYWRDSTRVFGHALNVTAPSPIVHGALGAALVERGDIEEGIAHLRSAVELAPGDARRHYNLACVLEKVGRVDEAQEQYYAALAADERDALAHNNLGAILCDRKQYEEAFIHLTRSNELDPEHSSASMNLGRLFAESGQFAEAIKWYENALRIDSGCSECQYSIGLAFKRLGDMDAAIEHFQAALELAPDNSHVRRQLARIYMETGDINAARAEYDQLLQR